MLPTIKIRLERWRFNKDYGVYVSTHGRFRNRDKADLPIKIKQNGYVVIKVDCTSCKYVFAHRLVMLTWRPTDEAEFLTVDHKDHNKRNNALDNLEWVSEEENLRRAKEDFISNSECTDSVTAPWLKFNNSYRKCIGFSVRGTSSSVAKFTCTLDNTPDEIAKFCARAQGHINNFQSKVFIDHTTKFSNGNNSSNLKKYCGLHIIPIWGYKE